jgi:hypothetical protein
MTSSVDKKTNVGYEKKPLPQPPQNKATSSTMGRKINLVSDDKVVSGNNKKSEKEIKTYASNKLNDTQNRQTDTRRSENEAIVIPSDSTGDISEISISNLPEGARIVKLESMTEGDKKKLKTLCTNYLTAAVKLQQFQDQQVAIEKKEVAIEKKEAALEEKKLLIQQLQRDKKLEEDRLNIEKEVRQLEIKRNAVKTVLSQNILRTSIDAICSFVSQADLDKIKCDLGNKECLIIAEDGMDSVLIPFLKAHDTKIVDLTIFKDEIHGNALIKLFKALPETQVTKVIISKIRQSTMTTEELTTMSLTKKSLASRGFTITLN